jgi:hypothetical protein
VSIRATCRLPLPARIVVDFDTGGGNTHDVRRIGGFLAVFAAAAVALVPVSGSQGASETQVDSIRLGPLDDGHQETGTVLLKAGVRYHLVVTGYVTQAGRDSSFGSYADDAFYHFHDSQHPGPPRPPGILFVGIRSEATGKVDFLRTSAEDRRDPPPYDPGHRYENHFTLKADGRLVVSAGGLGDPNFTYGGPGFVVSVLSGGGPAPPPVRRCATAAAGASAHAARAPSALICQTGSWGQTDGFVGLPPGGDAVAASPPLGNSTTAKVTLGGVTPWDLYVTSKRVSLARSRPGLIRSTCLLAAGRDLKAIIRSHANRDAVEGGIQRSILRTLTCLAIAEEIDAYVASHPEAAAAPAPASVCALTPFQVAVQSGRPTQVRVTGIGGTPDAPLHVTCLPSQGQLELTVATRTAGVPLSRFVGPRLQIGIVRSRRDQPGGQVAFRFDRP